MKEEWKEMKEYESLNKKYFISNLGNVKSYNKKKGTYRKVLGHKSDYHRVSFEQKGKVPARIYRYIHRLVYTYFVGEIKEGYIVHHVDGNKLNNKVTNLTQVTQNQNVNYSRKERGLGLLKDLTEEDVKGILADSLKGVPISHITKKYEASIPKVNNIIDTYITGDIKKQVDVLINDVVNKINVGDKHELFIKDKFSKLKEEHVNTILDKLEDVITEELKTKKYVREKDVLDILQKELPFSRTRIYEVLSHKEIVLPDTPFRRVRLNKELRKRLEVDGNHKYMVYIDTSKY